MSKTWRYKDANRFDLNVRWSSEVLMRTSSWSVANETVKHYGVTINNAEERRTGQLIISLIEMLSFVCYKPDTCKYKPAYKKSGSFLRKYL